MKIATKLALFATTLLGAGAHAQISDETCNSHVNMIAFTQRFGEVKDKIKFAYDGHKEFLGLIEWTENNHTGTWTLMLTAHGRTCLLASGARLGVVL
jgi:hypothetical protein